MPAEYCDPTSRRNACFFRRLADLQPGEERPTLTPLAGC